MTHEQGVKVLSDLEQFLADTIDDSAEFATYCTNNLGATMNTAVNLIDQGTPYFVSRGTKYMLEEKKYEWHLQFIISIASTYTTVEVDGTRVHEPSKSLKLVTAEAISVIEQALACQMFEGEKMLIDYLDALFNEPNETASDIQSVVTLKLTTESYL